MPETVEDALVPLTVAEAVQIVRKLTSAKQAIDAEIDVYHKKILLRWLKDEVLAPAIDTLAGALGRYKRTQEKQG